MFLGSGLTGFLTWALGGFGWMRARAVDAASAPGGAAQAKNRTGYWTRTDRLEEKVRLLEAAWQKKDFRQARALAHSIRTTAVQAQAEEESLPGPLMPAGQHGLVEELPLPWKRWAQGWKFYKVLAIEETAGEDRPAEPVEVALSFLKEQAGCLRRELRLARVEQGTLREVRSQVFDEVQRGNERRCRVLFMTEARARQRQLFLVFCGNPDAELPDYPTDLATTGEGFGLDIENRYFKASLSRQMGQLERLTLKREHGLELFSGGEGHGEPPGIDWAHDYVDAGGFQKLRITYWEACPDYEVVRGPLCTIVRRWGFPYSPVHPLFSPSRLNIEIEYRFYSGLPWFQKTARMEALKDFEAEAMRDDEWVFSGNSFTDSLWIGADGKVRMGEVPADDKDRLWGAGFFNRVSQDAFIALFLEHRAEGLPELKHSGAPTLAYRWHGQLWSRYPLPVKHVPAGAVLYERNAYVTQPFTAADGPGAIEGLRRRLTHPLAAAGATGLEGAEARECAGRLARPGEAADSPISKRVIWDALRDCKDAQLYAADINVVDLGLVQDIRVRADVVTVVMTMPHRGRPRLNYFTHGSISVHPTLSVPVRERLMKLPGVREVVVEQTWEPGWSSNQLTDDGRRKLGLDS